MLSLNKQQKIKLLKDLHSGNIAPIKQIKAKNRDFHWSCLRYEQTGDTALHCASQLGHKSTVAYLISSEFAPNGVNCKNNDDKTPLHEAAQFSHPEIVEILAKSGAEINALKRADWTPLMLACTKPCLKTAQILLEHNSAVNIPNKDGWTSLHLASRTGQTQIVEKLLEFHADFARKTKNGRTALHIAALHGHSEIVSVLLELGVEVDARDNCGNTPFHEAILGDNLKVALLLQEKGANIRAVNNVKFNLLHLASSEGYTEIISHFAHDFKDLNEVSDQGWTYLHCSARKNHISMFNYLLELGCDPNLRDKFGRVPREYFPLGKE